MASNFKRWAMTLLLSLAMIVTYMPMSLITAYAAAGGTPEHAKTMKVNDDGTYTIALDVKGEAERKVAKLNVLMIIDRSGSMRDPSGTEGVSYTPSNDNGNPRYGLVNGEYVLLERRSSGGCRPTYSYWYNGSQYTGTRYIRTDGAQSRMAAVKDAAGGLASTLLAYNTQEGNASDTVEMGLVSFSSMGSVDLTTKTNDLETFNEALNGLTANGGTNWESALKTASGFSFNDDDPTYVIFFSDGAPTYYLNAAGTGPQGSGYEEEPNMENSYNAATDDAATLAEAVGVDNFYTIFAYGEDYGADYMTALTAAAGAPAGNNYSAESTQQLQEAFAEILAKIETAGFAQVEMTDGTTSSVSTSSGTAHLLDVDTDSFKYYRSGGAYGNEYDPAYGKYGQEWTNPTNEAKFENDAVTWDLGEGVLEDGVTYTVTFDCWPSQETLDYIADIKNDPTVYDSLDDNIKKYLSKDGNLLTNTSTNLAYVDTRTGKSGNSAFNTIDPVATTAVESLAVSKEWKNDLESKWDKPKSIDLNVTRDSVNTYDMTLGDDNAWTDSVFISTGIMRTDAEGNVELLTTGHDFSFTEPENLTYHWELDVPVVRPMKINGEDKILIKVDEKHKPGSAKTYTLPTVGDIEGGEYYEGNLEEMGLTATNERRSNLHLTKAVTGKDVPADAEFPFTLKVVNSAASEGSEADLDSDYWVWFSVYNGGYVDAVVSGAEKEIGADGQWTGYYYAPSGSNISVKLKAGDNLRFLNLPTDSTYEFTESDLAKGFSFVSAAQSKIKGSGDLDPEFSSGRTSKGTIVSTNTDYLVTYTNKYDLVDINVDKVWVDANDQDGIRPKELALTLNGLPDGVTAPDPEITKSEDGNTWTYIWKAVPRYDDQGQEIAYTVTETAVPDGYTCDTTTVSDDGTITNTHTPETKEFTGTKTWDDEKYSTGDAAEIGTANEYARPSSIKIVLTGSDGKTYNVVLDGKKDDEPTAAAPSGYESEAWAYKFVNLPKYTNGKEITYTVTEEEVNEGDLDGYKDPTVSGGNVTNTPDEAEEVGEIDMTLNKTDANTGNPIDGAVFTLKGPSGEGSTSEDITVTEGSVNHKFTKPGTYTLKEKKAPAGYQADTKEYKIVVSKKLDSIKLKSSVWTWAYSLIFGEGTETTFDSKTNTLTIPNTPTTTDVEATKVWDDNNNQDGKRDDVTFVLKADGEAVSGQDKVIKKDATGNALKVSWTGLDAYKDGAKIVYTVEEKGASGGKITMNGAEYSVKTEGDAEKGFKITNSYSPEKTTVTVNKTWVGDDEWKDTVRPDSITVNLEADGAAAVDTAGEAVPAATITPDNDGNWTYTFTNLPKYKDGKAIKYTVAEDAVAGYTTTYSEDTLTINNTYAPTPTTAEFKVKKNLVVPPGLDGPAAWSYDITAAANGTAPAPETATQTVTQAADTATFTFADDAFKKPGTYTYTITEAGEVDGVTNDPSEGKTVTVTVTGNKNGTLSAAVTPNTAGVAAAFNNTYGAKPVSVDPPVQKVIVGNDDLYNKGDFTFTIANTAKPATVETAPMPAKASIKNQASDELADNPGFYEFGPITFTAPGTYTYAVTESGSAPGVTNDTQATKSFTFTVEDDGEGGLTVTPSSDEAVFVFTNVYDASGSIQLQATKAISGREWKDGDSFTFKLIDETGATVDTQTATSTKKTVTFAEIEYGLDDVGEHTYTITETGDLPAGMTKSGDITATVTVSDNGEGELETSVSYNNNDTITNTYEAEPTNAVIEVNKNIKGYLKDDSGNADATFKFELLDNDGKKIDETSITTEDGKGKAEFKAIEYKEAGTYTYTVKETVETKAGFTYDVSTYTATVTVTDNTDKGKLEANVSYKKADADATDITFENEFKMTSVKVDLKLNKEIDDKSDSAHDSTFRFTLKDPDGKEVATKEIKTKDLKGSTVFEDIEFTKAGEYIYTVTEEDTGEAGFKYDTTEHTYKIIVKNNFDTAVVEVDEEGSTLEAKIINEYKAADTAIVLKATKDINDTSDSAYDTEFTFTLKDKDGKTIDTKSVTGKGEVSFEEIPYEKAGTYKYTIQETAGDAKGYTYDSKVYNVTVKVVDEEGKLVATAKYDTDESGEGKTDLTITNTYDPEDAKIALEANKLIEDKTGGATGKTFKFELLEDDKVIDTASRVGGGPVSFKEITYSKVGEHNYKIREVAGEDSGYTYDTNEYPVKVVVTDPDKDGVLKAAITEGDKVEITNIYEAKPVKAAVKAKKVLEGRALKSGEFKFQLMEDGKVVSEGTNAADGSIVFGEITYKKTGVYNYTVAEVAGSDTSVTYDKALYPVTVTVTDDGEGKLKAAISGTPVFRNTFVEPPKEGSNRPKTGDTNDLTGMLGLMGTSAAGLMYMFFRRRREDSL